MQNLSSIAPTIGPERAYACLAVLGNRAVPAGSKNAAKAPPPPTSSDRSSRASGSPAGKKSLTRALPGNLTSRRTPKSLPEPTHASTAARPPNSVTPRRKRPSARPRPSATQRTGPGDQLATSPSSSPSSSSSAESGSNDSGGDDEPSALLGASPSRGVRFDQVCLWSGFGAVRVSLVRRNYGDGAGGAGARWWSWWCSR